MKKSIGIVGSGISALSVGRMLNDDYEVTLMEKKPYAGGLVRCELAQDNLYHLVGGHVFNSRKQEVLDWFWQHFDRDNEFIKATRNAKIWLNGEYIGYPIENYLFQLPKPMVEQIIHEMLENKNLEHPISQNFADFLLENFGQTLYNTYFKPYNEKIWRTDLETVPLEWLEGKLPMPNLNQMLVANICRQKESEMVHASFYYAKKNGSQFIVDRLSEGLKIWHSSPVNRLERQGGQWLVNDEIVFDHIIYTGDVRQLHQILGQSKTAPESTLQAAQACVSLKTNGTSSMLCSSEPTDLSWLYLPDTDTQAHRIIYTGNFSETNNSDALKAAGRISCVVEFSGQVGYEQMAAEIGLLPGKLLPIHYSHEPNSYIIHDKNTANAVEKLRSELEPQNFWLLGRFAEWQYYNMDKAIEASMSTVAKINQKA